jgi:Flp pilus assembly protein TadG
MSFQEMCKYPLHTACRKLLRRWAISEDGVAAVEAAMIFPILLVMLLGVFDMGNAILANQKAIRSSQVVADLVTRARSVNSTDIDEAVEAGRLAFEPLDSSSYGVDIISMRFDASATPQIVWRETQGMSPVANPQAHVGSLAEPGGGVVMVAVEYQFIPVFVSVLSDRMHMQEIAFARGRKSAVVNRN